MNKKILAIFLAILMVFSLSACGNKGGKTEDGSPMPEGFVFEGNDSQEETVALGTPSTKLNPQDVYNKLTYTPEMFYGDYRLLGGDDAQEKFGAEAQYFKWTQKGTEKEYSKLPFRIKAGKKTLMHSVNYIKEYNWMELSFMRNYSETSCNLETALCAYSIEGNKLILKPLDTFNVDKETNKITYTFADVTWEYAFSFKGRTLTLEADGNSIALTTCLDAYGEKDYVFAEGYLSPGSESAHNIDYIRFRYDSEDKDSSLSFEMVDEKRSHNSIAVLEENGLFTFTLSLEDSKETYQYVCFCAANDGLVLTDGTNTYYYNDTYSDRHKLNLSEYLTEDQTGKLDELSDSQLEAIVEKKENLMEDLAKAFNDAGIKVTVDEKTGELAMDSSVLFGGDSAILTAEGKTFLNKFVDVYTSIVFSEKYEGFVSKTMVEGHTAPVSGSTYESGLPLSEQRANNVKDYCVSSDTGVDTSKLASNLEAIGYSNSKPVKDADGNVDMAASRRVSLRFIINLEQQ